MTSKKTSRMGGLGKLSDFGKSTPAPTSVIDTPIETDLSSVPSESENAPSSQSNGSPQVSEPLTTINIKVKRNQHQWLSETARQVRDNNLDPVAPGDRVYPQHLIGVAIELLKSRKIDWTRIKTVEDLQKQLRL